jgi:hypothetical protein
MNKKSGIKEVSVDEFIDAIKKLPSAEPKNQWIRWLSEYDEPGYYNRLAGMNRSAKFAYNNIANPEMLLWLIQAAGIDKDLVDFAKSDCAKVSNVRRQSAAIRKRVPWAILERALWRPAR